MEYDVVVVGAGVGGLTTAALLAARGRKVCLLEKEPRGGGCAATFPRSGYTFEAGPSLYASWEPGEIHDRIFTELGTSPPETRVVAPSYVVRLPDGQDIPISVDQGEFEESLATHFPECARAAINFYREITNIGDALRRAARREPALRTASKGRLACAIGPEFRIAPRALPGMNRTVAHYLGSTSPGFRRFIDVQLQIFGQRPSEQCAYLFGAVALTLPRRGMYAIKGGASGLTDALADSIKNSGGTLRFNSTALRLYYDEAGRAAGVELLNGERIHATSGIVSNLTVWDTYGRLVGTDRTPAQVRTRLKAVQGWGAYLLYLGIEEEAAEKLKAEHILALTDWQPGEAFDPEGRQFMFGVAPPWDPRAPAGKRAVTVSTFTEASQWFSYHESEEEHEQQDQAMLEKQWELIHRAMPELGSSVEVIETATPRTFFDYTRRKLGMVGGIGQSLDVFGMRSFSHLTEIPNLYLVGDTVFPGQGVAGVTQSALIAANAIAPVKKNLPQ
jgi:C-3',4' desaturase CrtD